MLGSYAFTSMEYSITSQTSQFLLVKNITTYVCINAQSLFQLTANIDDRLLRLDIGEPHGYFVALAIKMFMEAS